MKLTNNDCYSDLTQTMDVQIGWNTSIGLITHHVCQLRIEGVPLLEDPLDLQHLVQILGDLKVSVVHSEINQYHLWFYFTPLQAKILKVV